MNLEEIKIEIRSLNEKVENGEIKAKDALETLKELRSKKEIMEKQIAMENKPTEIRSINYADLKDAMLNKRSITLGGTGAVGQVKELFKVITSKTPVLNGVRKFVGANAQTNIPVLTAYPATNNYAEASTEVSVDNQGAMAATVLTPYSWVSLLPVSAEAIALGTVDIENELPAIFADAFASAFHNQVLVGDGTGRNFKGIFTAVPSANQISVAGASVKMSDLVNLALQIQDKADNACIIMNPAIYSAIMSDNSSGIDVYREGLARDKQIEGVKVILTSNAPSAVTSGSVIAVAGKLDDYAFGEAGEILIEPIKKVGDSRTFYQATMFVNGKPVNDANFYGLVM